MLAISASKSSTAFNIIVTLTLIGLCESFPYQYFQRFYYLPHYHPDGYVQGYDCDLPGHVDYSYNLAQDDFLHPQGNFLGDGYWKHRAIPPKADPVQRYSYIAPNGMLYVTDDTSSRQNTFQVPAGNAFRPPGGVSTGTQNGMQPPRNNNQPSGSNRNATVPNDRRTNQLGIPSAALASLSGGGLG
ncbi:uncharacterized protein LOC132696727 [Cylas formicarius]|uniref:uncharacterized protein LOC132696727 n=1 Tax=Cylas formicarius TaxID=197179 RepID=UPI00295898D0|nr:uncharacterized protein LOC132696727 [Cylas formicarius]